MPSVLRQLQAEWNAMVPAAQARGVPRVRILGGGDVNRAPLETIAYRRQKLEWLRAILGGSTLDGLTGLSFGVELEVFLPMAISRDEAARRIVAAGVPCQNQHYNHTTPSGTWKIVHDMSLRGQRGYHGAEFVSPPMRGEEGFRQLSAVCRALVAMGATVNKSCGLHVHVGVGTEGVPFFKNLVRLYHSAELAIDAIMPASRRGNANDFCRATRINEAALQTATTVKEVAHAIGQNLDGGPRDWDRYKKLNLKSFRPYGTVEFRQHAGTVEADKATNWVRFCLRMVLTAKAGEKTPSTLEDLLDAISADDAEKAFFRGRAAYFARGSAFAQVQSTSLAARQGLPQPMAIETPVRMDIETPPTATPWIEGNEGAE